MRPVRILKLIPFTIKIIILFIFKVDVRWLTADQRVLTVRHREGIWNDMKGHRLTTDKTKWFLCTKDRKTVGIKYSAEEMATFFHLKDWKHRERKWAGSPYWVFSKLPPPGISHQCCELGQTEGKCQSFHLGEECGGEECCRNLPWLFVGPPRRATWPLLRADRAEPLGAGLAPHQSLPSNTEELSLQPYLRNCWKYGS